MKSASTDSSVSPLNKAVYLGKLLGMRLAGWLRPPAEIGPWEDFAFYEDLYRRFAADTKLGNLKILELGYGQRPWRLVSLLCLGADAWGIDLESPMFGFAPRRLVETWRLNGTERALKSAVRSLLFDSSDIRRLRKEIEERGAKFRFDKKRFLVGNATQKIEDLEGRDFDLVISEDVFEHIPGADIGLILENLKSVAATGLLFIRPHIFTGIAGGHDPEYYPHRVLAGASRRDLPWSHLRHANFSVNTYLNRLRIADYRALFRKQFSILAEIPKYDRLGREYLTPAIRAEIPAEIADEELMTNQVMFVLGPQNVKLEDGTSEAS